MRTMASTEVTWSMKGYGVDEDGQLIFLEDDEWGD